MALNTVTESSKPACAAPPHGSVFETIIPGVAQKVPFTGTAAQSAAFAATTSVVRLCSDVDCWVRFGTNPTAVVTDHYLPAKIPTLFGVTPLQKVSAIGGGAGNLYVSEGA